MFACALLEKQMMVMCPNLVSTIYSRFELLLRSAMSVSCQGVWLVERVTVPPGFKL